MNRMISSAEFEEARKQNLFIEDSFETDPDESDMSQQYSGRKYDLEPVKTTNQLGFVK